MLAPVLAYGLAWIGHLIFQKNKPATFEAPIYSVMGDFRMFYELLTGTIPFDEKLFRRRRI